MQVYAPRRVVRASLPPCRWRDGSVAGATVRRAGYLITFMCGNDTCSRSVRGGERCEWLVLQLLAVGSMSGESPFGAAQRGDGKNTGKRLGYTLEQRTHARSLFVFQQITIV
jgi:hypothetical protein